VSPSTTGSSTLSNSRGRGSMTSGSSSSSSSSQEWIGVCNAARRTLAELVAPLASVRWQVTCSSFTINKCYCMLLSFTTYRLQYIATGTCRSQSCADVDSLSRLVCAHACENTHTELLLYNSTTCVLCLYYVPRVFCYRSSLQL
jgi:hypothetical protein